MRNSSANVFELMHSNHQMQNPNELHMPASQFLQQTYNQR